MLEARLRALAGAFWSNLPTGAIISGVYIAIYAASYLGILKSIPLLDYVSSKLSEIGPAWAIVLAATLFILIPTARALTEVFAPEERS